MKNVSYNQVYEQVRSIIVDVFSNKYVFVVLLFHFFVLFMLWHDIILIVIFHPVHTTYRYSASVQQTIYDSGEEILKRVPSLYSVHMVLPNIHIFHYDIDRFGVKNDDEIYAPQSDPSGFIEGSVVRQVSKL